MEFVDGLGADDGGGDGRAGQQPGPPPGPRVHPASLRRQPDHLATNLREAADAGEIAALTQADIDQEVRLVTAVLDGIWLQWLLDPSTDVVASVTAYTTHSITRWRSGLQGRHQPPWLEAVRPAVTVSRSASGTGSGTQMP